MDLLRNITEGTGFSVMVRRAGLFQSYSKRYSGIGGCALFANRTWDDMGSRFRTTFNVLEISLQRTDAEES